MDETHRSTSGAPGASTRDHGTSTLAERPDPGRFTGTREVQARPERRLGEVVGAGLALLALVVGLPVALLALGAPPPVPTEVPEVRELARQIGVEDLLTVLVAVVWLAWAYFLVCIAVEVRAALRGGLARSVPLAGPLQGLARVLVGALLMTGVMAAPAQAAGLEAGAASAAASPGFSQVVQVDGAGPVGPAGGTTVERAAADPDDRLAQRVEQRLDGHKVYTVKPPVDGYHDNLWDIAERHLGDGRRYAEIYQLNKDRVQLDGQRLDLARLIQPGWELVMPEDAVGVDRFVAPADPAPAEPGSEPGAATDAPGGAEAAAEAGAAGGSAGGGAAGTGGLSTQEVAATGGGLVAAAALGALLLQRRRRLGRRPEDDALEVEEDLRVAATAARAGFLDRALRDLAVRCRQAGVPLPPAYAALVSDDGLELRLAPAAATAVDGWEVAEDGRSWARVPGHPVLDASASEVAPYPGLVSLGVHEDGRDVMVDLEAAGGVISLAGDPTVVGEVAAAVAVQAATAAWADQLRLTATGMPSGLERLGEAGPGGADRVRVVTDLEPELAELEATIGQLRGDVLSGRMSRRGSAPSRLVVCGEVPDDATAERLRLLTGRGRQAFSVLLAGEHRSARWRLVVDENGVLTLPQLDLVVQANRLPARQVEGLAELFAATDEVPVDHGDRVAVPAPLRAHDDAAWTTAPRRVGVLGPLAVQGGAPLPDARAELARELVTYLALHPEGVHPTVLAGAVWPRGVTADVRDSTIDRVRAWLGAEPDGSHYLRADAEGRLRLSDAVVCDWDCLRTLLLASRSAGSPRAEAEQLRRALQLVRGEPFGNAPQGRYAWVAREDLPRVMSRVVVDAAHRLAELLHDDDPAGASQGAAAGLRLVPGSQLLWRDLLRARHATSGVAGVQQTLDEMVGALHGVALEAETEALVAELWPEGAGGTAAAG